MPKISRIFTKKNSLKNTKMGDKLLLMPYFDNFDFQCTLFSKNAPKFWSPIPNQAKLQEIFMAVFIDIWPCLFTTKLSYAQLFKWGHSRQSHSTRKSILDCFYRYPKFLLHKQSHQTMTEAGHNRPISKLFDNRPLASAAEVFCETIGLVIYIKNILRIVYFSLLLSWKEAWLNANLQAPRP